MVDRSPGSHRYSAPGPRNEMTPQMNSGASAPLTPRPWHQWHAAMRVTEPSPLQVDVAKRPQWGRYVYLAIILLIAAAVAKVIFGHVFWYNASGVIAGQRYNVSSIYPAMVLDIMVKPSEHVQAGQPLVKLGSPQLRRQLALSSTNLARMQQQAVTSSSADNVATLKAQAKSLKSQAHALGVGLAAQQRQIHSLRELVAAHAANAGSLLPLQAQEAKTRAQYDAARSQLQSVHVQLHDIAAGEHAAGGDTREQLIGSLTRYRNTLHSELADLTLTAPVSGEVAEVDVTPGAVLRPGDSALVIVTGDGRRTYLSFPPAAQNHLHVGQDVAVTGPNGDQLSMRITNIYPSLQQLPGTGASVPTSGAASPKVIAVAEPLHNGHWPAALRSGTPVSSRIPRWLAPMRWWNQLKGFVSSRLASVNH